MKDYDYIHKLDDLDYLIEEVNNQDITMDTSKGELLELLDKLVQIVTIQQELIKILYRS